MDSKVKDGGPAFPPNAGWRDDDVNCRGMTLRDYFAAKALAGAVSHSLLEIKPENVDRIACVIWQIADAMLAERAK